MSESPLRIDPRKADDFAAAMARERGVPPTAKAAPAPAAALRVVAPPRPDDVELGLAEIGGAVGLSLGGLIDGRLLIQGVSGSGKSWTLRRLVEQTQGRVQRILIDPEGEFADLSRELDFVELDAAALDLATVAAAAARLREHRLSARLDLSQCERERQLQIFAAFVRALIDAPREHWSSALVLVDEAHLFAPFGGSIDGAGSTRREAIGALTDLMSRGRKRGLAGVLATQRLARLAKSVASEAQNFLVGRNTLDLDIRRAAESLGWDSRRAFDRLPLLEPGDFAAVGPAFSRSPALLRVGAIRARHGGARPALQAPVEIGAAVGAARIGLHDLLEETKAAAIARGDVSRLPAGARAVRGFIKDPQAGIALRAYELLAPLAPEGAALADLRKVLDVEEKTFLFAIALLDSFGAIEFSGDSATRAVRISRGMR